MILQLLNTQDEELKVQSGITDPEDEDTEVLEDIEDEDIEDEDEGTEDEETEVAA